MTNFNPEAAREALAQAEVMTTAAERRGAWSPGLALLDALLEGAVITPLMFAVICYPGSLSNMLFVAAIAASLPSAWLRVRVGMRTGVLMRVQKRHMPWIVARSTLVVLTIVVAAKTGWLWAAWATALMLMVAHYCLRRSGRLL